MERPALEPFSPLSQLLQLPRVRVDRVLEAKRGTMGIACVRQSAYHLLNEVPGSEGRRIR